YGNGDELKVELAGRNGLKLVADVEGDPAAPPVILLHGGGQTRHAWGTTLKVLGAHWHAYSVDLRGHGESDWAPDGDYSIDAFAKDVEVIARSMPSPPVLVGASLGGISSLAAIAESEGPPLARALVLVDVAPRIEAKGASRIIDFMKGNLEGFESLDEVADVIAAYNPNRPRPKNLEGLKKNLRQRADGRWVWHWDPRFVSGDLGSPDETRSSGNKDNRLERAARTLTIPTLLVRGRMSDLLSEQGVKELKELVPHAQIADVAGAGHMVAGDRNDAFNDSIVDFLEALPN
ncbi:MAG: alpha/beta hydrolase, partial [Microthrixaceae bacterium]